MGRIAQFVEQLTLSQRVQGSSPCAPTIENHRLMPVCGAANVNSEGQIAEFVEDDEVEAREVIGEPSLAAGARFGLDLVAAWTLSPN